MVALASVADLTVRLGGSPLSDADTSRATAALDDASALVRTAAGTDLLTAENAPPAVITVVIQVALRLFRNPEGYSGEAMDGYSWQAPPGSVSAYLTADELAVIRDAMRAPGAPAARTGVTSVRTPSPYGCPPDDLALWGLL